MVIHQRKKTLGSRHRAGLRRGGSLSATSTPCSSKRSSSGRQRPGQLDKRPHQKRLIMRRPRIKGHASARKGRVRLQPQAAGGYRRPPHFLHRPALARLRIAMQRRRRPKGVKRRVIRRMHRHQLSFRVVDSSLIASPCSARMPLTSSQSGSPPPARHQNRRVVAGICNAQAPGRRPTALSPPDLNGACGPG